MHEKTCEFFFLAEIALPLRNKCSYYKYLIQLQGVALHSRTLREESKSACNLDVTGNVLTSFSQNVALFYFSASV